MNNRYSGAYSRRRYSNFTTTADTPLKDTDGTDGSTQQVTLRVDFDASLGRVTAAGMKDGAITAPKGTQVTLEATPIGSARFVCWSLPVKNNSVKDTANKITLTLTGNERIKAVFAGEQQKENIQVAPHVLTPEPSPSPSPVNPTVNYLDAGGAGLMDKAMSFAKKWWWALLIVAYLVYKETKGGSK